MHKTTNLFFVQRRLAEILLLFFCSLLAASPLVVNGDFTIPQANGGNIPAHWVLPDPPGVWQRGLPEDNKGRSCLIYRAKKTLFSAAATQAIRLLPSTTYILSCSMKPDAGLKPVIRLKSAGSENLELVRLTGDGSAGIWEAQAIEFDSATGSEVVVELWADQLHLSRQYVRPAGSVAFASIALRKKEPGGPLPSSLNGTMITRNLARGKKYTLNPAPAYAHTKDPGDLQDLTDGQYSEGYFWTQKTTVGWVRVPVAEITLDLESVHPVSGLSLNTAFGIAGAQPAESIEILASLDGRHFHPVGDLAEQSKQRNPLPNGYSQYRFYTNQLQIPARYLKVLVTLSGTTFFCDEIEVYRGDKQWLSKSLPGTARLFPREHFTRDLFNANRLRRIEIDLNHAEELLMQEPCPPEAKKRLLGQLQTLAAKIPALPDESPEGFRGIMPMNQTHAEIYAAIGALRKSQGKPALLTWGANRWDFLSPTQLPAKTGSAELNIHAMLNEAKSAALNLSNCSENELQIHLHFEGFPGGGRPDYVKIREVLWTDTNENILIASALSDAQQSATGWQVTIPAGMTRQLWFSFHTQHLPAGNHTGFLKFSGSKEISQSLPVALRIFNLRFPERPRLHLGGWDYSNSLLYGLTAQNRAPLMAFLQKNFVDSPWATRDVLPFGKFGDDGQLQQTPSTHSFDQWISLWPDARRFHVFLLVDRHPEIEGTKPDSPLFAKKIAQWIDFWVAHARTRGISPQQLCLLLVDEAGSEADDKLILDWARAIKTAQPKVTIWDDGSRPPERLTSDLQAMIDCFCPGRASIRANGKNIQTRTVYQQHTASGKRLDLYSCSDRVKLRDPYTYFRLQAWDLFQLGGEGSQFWSFSGRAGSSWNEYENRSPDFAPFFLDSHSVTTGKHMEAIRESAVDFEYLSMLRDEIGQLERSGANPELLREAKLLLDKALDLVLSPPDTCNLIWYEEIDRGQADAALQQIGSLLEKMATLR